MPINITQVTKQDWPAWDAYVANHSQATPYHSSAWQRSVVDAYGQQPASLIATDKEQIVGVLPLIRMRRPFSASYLCALPYCDLGFALADSPAISQTLLEQATQLKASRLEYRDQGTTAEDHTPPTGSKVRMLLALPETSEALMASFKSKLRSQIRKAEKNGLTFVQGNSPELIAHFYAIFAQNMRKLGSPVHSHQWFTQLAIHYAENLLVSVVYHDDQAIGAGIILTNGQQVSIPWASTLAEHNKLAPNMLLYWSLLSYSADNGFKVFDFGRSSYGEGTFKFKQQWGAQPVPLNWHDGTQATQQEQQATHTTSRLRALVENLWRKLPLPVTTWLGPQIRRHISL